LDHFAQLLEQADAGARGGPEANNNVAAAILFDEHVVGRLIGDHDEIWGELIQSADNDGFVVQVLA